MVHKLKFLKAYFTRTIVPAVGATVGTILYTAKNITGRRRQFVIDVDANTIKDTTINADPANPATSPGQVVVTTKIAPQTDKNLYILSGTAKPTMTQVIPSNYTQTIANGGSIVAINVKTNATLTNGTAKVASDLGSDGLTLNVSSGAVTLDDNLTAGTYTLEYKVADSVEPDVYVTGEISIIVEEA